MLRLVSLTAASESHFPVRNTVIPEESFVAPSIDLGQIDTDSSGMTVQLTGKGYPGITVRWTSGITLCTYYRLPTTYYLLPTTCNRKNKITEFVALGQFTPGEIGLFDDL